jgi:hypothetical protein
MLAATPTETIELDLLYVRHRHGWSDLHIVVEPPPTQHKIGITHIFNDPMADLCDFCCRLLNTSERCVVGLRDEPGETFIVAERFKSQKHLARFEVWECPDWQNEPESGALRVSFDAKIALFAGLLYRQFEKTSWLFEDKRYRIGRDGFPKSSFNAFKQAYHAHIGNQPK